MSTGESLARRASGKNINLFSGASRTKESRNCRKLFGENCFTQADAVLSLVLLFIAASFGYDRPCCATGARRKALRRQFGGGVSVLQYVKE
jgi:hypothetical protein